MKKLFLTILLITLLLTPYQTHAATAFVQAKNKEYPGSALTITVTWASNTTTGNLVACYLHWFSSTIDVSTFTDSQSNVYTAVDFNNNTDAGADRTRTYYAKNITGGVTPTVTATFGSSANAALTCHEISGADTTAPLDQHKITATGFFSSTVADALSSGSVTTTADGEYIAGFNEDNGNGTTVAAGTGYNSRSSAGNGGRSEDKIQTTAGAIAATFTKSAGSGNEFPAVMTFKAASAAVTARTGDWFLNGLMFLNGLFFIN